MSTGKEYSKEHDPSTPGHVTHPANPKQNPANPGKANDETAADRNKAQDKAHDKAQP